MQLSEQLSAFAADHRGLVTRDAAKAVGTNTNYWSQFVKRCGLVSVYWNVARIPEVETSLLQSIQAAVLSCGPDAVASHRSAAVLFGCGLPDTRIDVTVPRRSRLIRTNFSIHRPRHPSDLDPSVRLGIACSNPVQMLAELGEVCPKLVVAAMDHAILKGLATPSTIKRANDDWERQGRRETSALARALEVWPLGEHVPDSQLEVDFARLLVANGLQNFEFHARAEGLEVDFAFHREQLIIETDGWEFHRSRTAFEEDRRRDAVLATKGWLVLRYTWRKLRNDPGSVLAQVRQVLGQRS